jgi:hypothetical protein
MNTLAVLTELSERGICVQPKGHEKVHVTPREKLTPDLIDRIRRAKPTLLSALDRIRQDSGDEWPQIAADPRQLKAYFELSMIEDMRQRGIAPDHYTATTTCKQCGPVPIWQGCPPEVLGCPWCFNRLQGLPLPRRIL